MQKIKINDNLTLRVNNNLIVNNIKIFNKDNLEVKTVRINNQFDDVTYKEYIKLLFLCSAPDLMLNSKKFKDFDLDYLRDLLGENLSLDKYIGLQADKIGYQSNEIKVNYSDSETSSRSESKTDTKAIMLIGGMFLIISDNSWESTQTRDGCQTGFTSFDNTIILNIKNNRKIKFFHELKKYSGKLVFRITGNLNFELFTFGTNFFISDILFEKYIIIIDSEKESLDDILKFNVYKFGDKKLITIVETNTNENITINFIDFLHFLINVIEYTDNEDKNSIISSLKYILSYCIKSHEYRMNNNL